MKKLLGLRLGLNPIEWTRLWLQNGRELPGGSHAVSILDRVTTPRL